LLLKPLQLGGSLVHKHALFEKFFAEVRHVSTLLGQHLQQELRSRRESSYWLVQQKKKKKKTIQGGNAVSARY
jgi:hypothetical protein